MERNRSRVSTLSALPLAVALACLNAEPATAQAFDASAVDTSAWACEYCPWPDGVDGRIDIGINWVSQDAFRFGDYRGLEEGSNALLGGTAVRSTEDDYWAIRARDLGIDGRQFFVDGGRPGSWRVTGSWRELPRRINDTPATPYAGIGSQDITLPDDWVTAPFTQDMTQLDASSRVFDLRSDRDRLDLGLHITPGGNIDYKLDYRRDMKEGVRALGGGFMFNSAVLPAPVDYVTDQLEASVGLSGERMSGEISYYGSFFENDRSRLRFDNAFDPLVPGADAGQFALEPDNEFHRLGVAGSYRIGEVSRLSARAGIGRMEQDDAFLPYTINPTPIAPEPLGPLPRNSLDGEVDVLDLNIGYDTRIDWGRGLRLSADYDYYERDNDTPRDDYTFVTQDLFVNPARRNLPFSYERQQFTLRGSYRWSSLRLAGGARYRDTERVLDEPADTDEIEGWLAASVPLGRAFDARVEVREASRDGEDLSPETAIAFGENPALRKFAYASRDRSQVQATLTAMPAASLQIAWHLAWTDDDYDESQLGLNASESTDYTFDITYSPDARWSVHAFWSEEEIDAQMTGNESLTPAFNGFDWFASTDDEIETRGIGLTVRDVAERGIDISFDYVESDSDSVYAVNDQTAPADFPTFETRLDGARVRVDWPLANGATVILDYYHESFRNTDWSVDGIEQATVFNLLGLGEDAFDYSVDTLSVWYRTGF